MENKEKDLSELLDLNDKLNSRLAILSLAVYGASEFISHLSNSETPIISNGLGFSFNDFEESLNQYINKVDSIKKDYLGRN
ncbi:MAG: hypothetical protein HYS24_12950 [Ignavibacteriales bacterium]|nr:hypothetical protein [Ignavibacteriales bacterium]